MTCVVTDTNLLRLSFYDRLVRAATRHWAMTCVVAYTNLLRRSFCDRLVLVAPHVVLVHVVVV